MSESELTNPLLDNKYISLRSSNDQVAKKIVDSATSIYKDAVIFNKTKESDVSTLDTTIVNIQSKFNDLIILATPCSSISNTDKCSTPICNYVTFIENLFLDLFMLMSDVIPMDKSPKSEYDFVTFFMVYYFSNMVTNNPNNRNKYDVDKEIYTLCSGQVYSPPKDPSDKTSKYNKILDRMSTSQNTTIVRQESSNNLSFLLYILVPTFVFIILILLYIKHTRAAALEELEISNAIASLKKK